MEDDCSHFERGDGIKKEKLRGLLPRGSQPFSCNTLSCCAPRFWRQNSHGHEEWMRVCPQKCLSLGFKKSIDHQGASFEECSPSAARRFAADHRRAGIDCKQSAIGKRYLAAVRNPARIDGAMSGPQARAGGTDVLPRPAIGTATSAGPVNRDSCEQLLLACKNGGSQKQDQSNSYGESFHLRLRDSIAEFPVALTNSRRRKPQRIVFP